MLRTVDHSTFFDVIINANKQGFQRNWFDYLFYILCLKKGFESVYTCLSYNFCVHVCCLHLKMEFCSCARGRQWCGIIHYH